MSRKSLLAIAMLASFALCGSALAFDQIGVPADSYTTTNHPSTSEADNSRADTGNAEESGSSVRYTISTALPQDEATEPASANNAAPADNDSAESTHPIQAHTNPGPSASHAVHARAPKNRATVHWQSLLPGVMK